MRYKRKVTGVPEELHYLKHFKLRTLGRVAEVKKYSGWLNWCLDMCWIYMRKVSSSGQWEIIQDNDDIFVFFSL